ncbi:PLP-dependent aminotransferase family protein [Phyllobacterium sp. LjRoot231]|uniref:aminotransferase-like domain-containing protein n=1 Tax=Phyllobacterium sp. LjRoot231 TaxID=3342289 RepID=UPI003ED0368C
MSKMWNPDLSVSAGPLYLAIAEAIASDVRSGRLRAGDRLPPQRELARRLDIDFTTVARGYVEARKRGLVDAHIGRGTFVLATPEAQLSILPIGTPDPKRQELIDLSMNLPPEPDDPDLIARMREGLSTVAANMVPLLRYQSFGGSAQDKEAASAWLSRRGLVPSQQRVFVTPGAHPAILAIFSMLAKPGQTILSENITYPGARSIAAQLRLHMHGLPMDEKGILPDAFSDACEKMAPKALYLNPTLQNPTTITIPEERRAEICAVARRFHVPIVEDDAYGFIPVHAPAPLATIAPDLVWHIGGLAKCIGAGLRLAYVVAPDTRAIWPFVSAMKASNVMASPLTVALATRWIEDGTADMILRFIRKETGARQAMAAEMLAPGSFKADPLSFNIWLPLSNGWTRSGLINHMRASGIGVLASDAFTVGGTPAEAARVCLGGPISRPQLRLGLEYLAHALEGSPEMASAFF